LLHIILVYYNDIFCVQAISYLIKNKKNLAMSLLWYSAMFLTDTPPTRTDVVSKTIQSFWYLQLWGEMCARLVYTIFPTWLELTKSCCEIYGENRI